MCWMNKVYTCTIKYIHVQSFMYTHTEVATTFHFKSGLIRLATPASFPTTLELSLACSIHPLSSLLDRQTNQAWLYSVIYLYIYIHTGIYIIHVHTGIYTFIHYSYLYIKVYTCIPLHACKSVLMAKIVSASTKACCAALMMCFTWIYR